jgi:hypothetical protein
VGILLLLRLACMRKELQECQQRCHVRDVLLRAAFLQLCGIRWVWRPLLQGCFKIPAQNAGSSCVTVRNEEHCQQHLCADRTCDAQPCNRWACLKASGRRHVGAADCTVSVPLTLCLHVNTSF